MVDSVGSWPVANGEHGVSRIRAAAPIAPPRDTLQPGAIPSHSPAGLVKQLATSAPIDLDRVAQLKAAIADGSYSIQPAAIADRLLAFKQEWRSDDTP